MTRFIALLFAALTLLAGAGHAQAQGFFGTDSRDIMGGGPNFFGGGGQVNCVLSPGFLAFYPACHSAHSVLIQKFYRQ